MKAKVRSRSGQGFITHKHALTHARTHAPCTTTAPYSARVLPVAGWRHITTAGPGMAPTNSLLFQSRI